MRPFTRLTSIAIPLMSDNVDTDIIIPARFLKTVTRDGLGKGAFYALRHTTDGTPNPDCILNDARYRGAQILLAGENFGCGSSREHAVWSILDLGIQCIVAASFADIFASNAFKNGLLCVELPARDLHFLASKAQREPITVDLESQAIESPGHAPIQFEIDSFRRNCLLNGLDEIALTLQSEGEIAAFESQQRSLQPWLYARE